MLQHRLNRKPLISPQLLFEADSFLDMTRFIFVAITLTNAVAAAPAFADNYQYDFSLIHRPPHITNEQIDVGVQAMTKVCDPSSELSYGSKQFLDCMRAHGYKLLRVERQKSPSSQKPSSTVKLARGHFINEYGMDCVSGDNCDYPKGTVHYWDPYQLLSCTRTGAMSICKNF